MANWQWFTKAHRAVYRATGGRLGSNLAGIRMLLLTTRGRRSGLPRTVPLACFQDGDDWVVVGSNDGQERDPVWWLNLQQEPRARIQVGAEQRDVVASLATPAERERLWPWLVKQNRQYAKYATRTSREIPVVILRRAGAAGA